MARTEVLTGDIEAALKGASTPDRAVGAVVQEACGVVEGVESVWTLLCGVDEGKSKGNYDMLLNRSRPAKSLKRLAGKVDLARFRARSMDVRDSERLAVTVGGSRQGGVR